MRTRSAMPAAVEVPPVLLDWRAARHFAETARPCWHCGAPTHLRDEDKRPADKVCAERARAEVLAVVATYGGQGRL
ncbi:hypothetical protein [Streptomyces sp. 2P-4]|uniref:hypothetical protein n=1 Tax=Streptomyces sp. 2P-4 TaxID=2931974 RepID=UPI0025412BC0|nr:hypothetical protein [Streptomyces sp. 2P-4]